MCERFAGTLWRVLVIGVLLAGTVVQAGDASLMARWKMDDGSGSVATDSSGNEYHGTITNPNGGLGVGGSVWLDDADRGMVISFDGTNYVDTDVTIPAMTLENGFTWAFWAKGDAAQSEENDVIFGNRYGGTSSPLQFIKFTPTKFEYYHNSTNYGLDYEDIENEVWMHHVVVKDGTSLTYYRNGVESVTGSISVTIDENPFYMGGDAQGESWMGSLSDARLYDGALSDKEVLGVMEGLGIGAASSPVPVDGATDVLRELVLSWTPGQVAVAHDVYFGASGDDVAAADRSNPLGVLVAEAQQAASYDVGRLEFGQTYYWRIDEVEGDGTVRKGLVWSFTVEPIAYAITGITATVVGNPDAETGLENAINGSGLNEDGQHSVDSGDMWSASLSEPLQVQFAFDGVYALYQMLVWNYNVELETMLGFGAKDVTVEYSVDGTEWTLLDQVEFAQAPGEETCTAGTILDFNSAQAQYVRLTISSSWGIYSSVGLSEVRFLYNPLSAHLPDPAIGATGVAPDATLSWRAGRQAGQHNVYVGTDEQAVIDGTASVVTVSEPSYDAILDLNQTYYWRVDEVNDAEDPTLWTGDVWTFATTESVLIEDFEDFDDDENLIYETWIDGWDNDTGSTVGYWELPITETTLAASGSQSMPLAYENTDGKTISQADRTFDTSQNWSLHGIKSLSLKFFGDPANTTGQLYVEINGTKVAYDGDASDLQIAAWSPWVIDLTGLNVQSVRTLSIGIEGSGASGLVLIDDIRVYPYEGAMVESVEPSDDDLVAYYPLDGDATDAVGGHDGTIAGTPDFVTGVAGQAIDLAVNATVAQEIIVPYADDFALNSFTVAAWVNVKDLDASRGILGTRFNSDNTFDFKLESTRVHGDVGDGDVWLSTGVDISEALGGAVSLGDWHHVACSVDAASGTANVYLDGVLGQTVTFDGTPLFMKSDQELHIGNSSNAEHMNGMVDEVRIYNRALSPGEMAGLSGRSGPFYLPF